MFTWRSYSKAIRVKGLDLPELSDAIREEQDLQYWEMVAAGIFNPEHAEQIPKAIQKKLYARRVAHQRADLEEAAMDWWLEQQDMDAIVKAYQERK